MTSIVIPPADAFGGRVNVATPLARVVGVLRRANPQAPYSDLKAAAEDLRRGGLPDRQPTPEPESAPEPVAEPRKRGGRRRPRSEAEASMVPVAGGEDIPAEPPTEW